MIFSLPTDLSKPVKIDLPISHAGAFLYWIEYDTTSATGEFKRVRGREGYFNIDPILRTKKRTSILSSKHTVTPDGHGGAVGTEYTDLPLDGIAALTLVSKWMGSLEEWSPHLAEASKRGYNMIHYTPLQQRGESSSPYSLADQVAYDAELFGPGWRALVMTAMPSSRRLSRRPRMSTGCWL